MHPPASMRTLSPDLPADQAFGALSGSGDLPLPVMHDGRVVGLLRAADVLRWLQLHQPG